MKSSAILQITPMRLPWKTQNPFIFCSYHFDQFPGGNDQLGPNVPVHNRPIGQDFSSIDGWNMYHGDTVPGFPAHPHRGFETISIVTQGLVDHTDSLGGSGRFGNGDVQWLTSGKGVLHAEMFPLVKPDKNPFEIFQLWLNLPQKSKMVQPHYKMLWSEDIPKIEVLDSENNKTTIDLIAGFYQDKKAISPTPNSWANDPENEVQVWTIKMEENASFTLPKASKHANRSIYFYEGESLQLEDKTLTRQHAVDLKADEEVVLKNGSKTGYLLFLQGRPINEPIVQHGPYVMNSEEDIREAMRDFGQTQFGGWPWETTSPVHPKSTKRFSKSSDGTMVLKE